MKITLNVDEVKQAVALWLNQTKLQKDVRVLTVEKEAYAENFIAEVEEQHGAEDGFAVP